MNSVNIVGRLGRDPELRYTPSNTPVVDLGIAISERVKKGEQWVDEVVWVDVTVWGKQAELASQYLTKGSQVGISGKLKLDSWEKDGKKSTKLKVTCERLTLCGAKGGSRGSDETSQEEPERRGEHSQAPPEPASGGGGYEDQGDIPFSPNYV